MESNRPGATQPRSAPLPDSPGGKRTPIEGIAEYAARFHSALGDGHVAASPLAAWLTLAIVAPLATGRLREALEQTLGCPADEAAAFATSLLAAPHPGVAAALGIWTDEETLRSVVVPEGLPRGLDVGPLPSQASADAWALQATQGRIDRFPIDLDPRLRLLLASALAIQAPWQANFEQVSIEEMGPTSWTDDVEQVMRCRPPGRQVIAWTASAGLVGVLEAPTKEAVRVLSVIADPSVPPAAVIAAAHDVALLRPGRMESRSLFDLPTEAGHAWDIVETEFMARKEGDRLESADVLLPAWEARTPPVDLLAQQAFGFDAAVGVLAERLSAAPGDLFGNAAQATLAKFDLRGFSAASVTNFGLFLSMSARRGKAPVARGLHRHATVRFARPYAVLAVAESPRMLQELRGLSMSGLPGPDPWSGVPVFTAWVTRPMEPDRDEREWMLQDFLSYSDSYPDS